jgi:hypothetical protein
LFAILILSFLGIGELSQPGSAHVGPQRRLASVDLYHTVASDWTHIPGVCKEDFPLTEFQKSQCDLFWKNVLTRAFFAILPFILTLLFYKLTTHLIGRTYQRAASRVARRRVHAMAEVVGEARLDFYGWLHGFQPIRATIDGENVKIVYLESRAQAGDSLHLYEAGRWFNRNPLVGVKTPRKAA